MVLLMTCLMRMKLNQITQEFRMSKKSGKLNEIVFDAYQKAINNRMKAGKDASRMVTRLNKLISESTSVPKKKIST